MIDAFRLQDVRAAACDVLTATAMSDAERLGDDLISGILNIPRLSIPGCLDELVTPAESQRISKAVARVAAGEPPQYVLGFAEFMGHRLTVDSRVLIPRPETEQLVELVLSHCAGAEHVVDCGTGSGCIAISLAKAHPGLHVTAIDQSEDALELAKANADSLNCGDQISFRSGDLMEGIESADAIVANLPYVSEDEYAQLDAPVRDHEPRKALVAGDQGLALIRALILQAATVLDQKGRIFLEYGYLQGPAVQQALEAAGFDEVRLLKDYQGHDRMASAMMRSAGPEPVNPVS